jgi:hypothetical protein
MIHNVLLSEARREHWLAKNHQEASTKEGEQELAGEVD